MSKEESDNLEGMKSTGYELFILLLSILSIFNLIVFLVPRIDPVVEGVVGLMDAFITVIFMLDFLYRLFTAESKTTYFFRNWGWADLLGSVPVAQLKIFRIFRIVRVIRILRIVGGRKMARELLHNRAGSALYLTIFMVFLVLEFGGIAIVYVETGAPGANIVTAGDGVWWSFVTITTVGYGDRYPVTGTGRLIGFLVMSIGVATFGVLTGFLANAFLSPAETDADEEKIETEPSGDLGEFRRLLEEQERLNAALRVKLEQLEAGARA